MDTKKPVILWLADSAGWAYDAIFQANSKLLPEYEHKVFYMMNERTVEYWIDFETLIPEADIIVSMYLLYQESVPFKDKVVTMLTGSRPFEK
jgi:hypothetical protein